MIIRNGKVRSLCFLWSTSVVRVIYALPTRQHRSLCELLTPSPSQPWFSHPAIAVHMCFALQALWQFFSNLPACYRATAPPGVSFSQADSVLLLLSQPSLPPKSPVTQRMGVPSFVLLEPFTPAACSRCPVLGWLAPCVPLLSAQAQVPRGSSQLLSPACGAPASPLTFLVHKPRSAGEFIPPPKKNLITNRGRAPDGCSSPLVPVPKAPGASFLWGTA